MSLKELLSIRSEPLGLLDNTLSGNYGYSRSNKENLPLKIQGKLSQKLETFSVIVQKFLESTWNFQCSEKKKKKKKNEPHSSIISQVIDSERCAYLNA